jgi:serine/threonine protein kinase
MAESAIAKPSKLPYTIQKKLGSGSFGTVFQVQRHKDGKVSSETRIGRGVADSNVTMLQILAMKKVDLSKMVPEVREKANKEV